LHISEPCGSQKILVGFADPNRRLLRSEHVFSGTGTVWIRLAHSRAQPCHSSITSLVAEAFDMIRKARNFDMSVSDPTPEQIRERSEAIRKGWGPRERARRSGFKRVHWTPPVFSDNELPGYSAGDSDR
jgi:hypothetical protein